jgi:hypothetical protein
MQNLRRAFLAPVLATVALLVGAPVAPAQEQEEFVTFQQAELITPFAVQVSGTLTCPSDAGSSGVSVRLLQRGGPGGFRSGDGFTNVPCTGFLEPFVVDVVGGPFRPSRATLVGNAFYCVSTPDFFRCFEDRDIQEIRIRR